MSPAKVLFSKATSRLALGQNKAEGKAMQGKGSVMLLLSNRGLFGILYYKIHEILKDGEGFVCKLQIPVSSLL